MTTRSEPETDAERLVGVIASLQNIVGAIERLAGQVERLADRLEELSPANREGERYLVIRDLRTGEERPVGRRREE